MDLTYWGNQIEALHASHDLVAYDLPGNGSTPGTPADWTFDAAVATLAQVLASTGAERANVVGISIGGMIAQAFALAHPEASAVAGADRHGQHLPGARAELRPRPGRNRTQRRHGGHHPADAGSLVHAGNKG